MPLHCRSERKRAVLLLCVGLFLLKSSAVTMANQSSAIAAQALLAPMVHIQKNTLARAFRHNSSPAHTAHYDRIAAAITNAWDEFSPYLTKLQQRGVEIVPVLQQPPLFQDSGSNTPGLFIQNNRLIVYPGGFANEEMATTLFWQTVMPFWEQMLAYFFSHPEKFNPQPWPRESIIAYQSLFCFNISLLAIQNTELILDIGTGSTAAIPLAAADYSDHVHAIDISPIVLAAARSEAELYNVLPNISFTAATALSLPYKNASFDRVFCAHTLFLFPPSCRHHILREIYRILKPGGCLHCIEDIAHDDVNFAWDYHTWQQALTAANMAVESIFFGPDWPKFSPEQWESSVKHLFNPKLVKIWVTAKKSASSSAQERRNIDRNLSSFMVDLFATSL